MLRFIILSTQRSGTEYLVDLLNSHGNIYCHSELLDVRNKPNFFDFATKRIKEEDTLNFRPDSVFNIWQELLLQGAITKSTLSALGCKIMYNQISTIPSNLFEQISKQYSVVHLVRRNILRTYVSNCINRSTSTPAHAEKSPSEVTRIVLPLSGLIETLDRRARAI